jgi:hypothetical protein
MEGRRRDFLICLWRFLLILVCLCLGSSYEQFMCLRFDARVLCKTISDSWLGIIGAHNVQSLTIDEIMIESDHAASEICDWYVLSHLSCLLLISRVNVFIPRKTHPFGRKLFCVCSTLPGTGRPFALTLVPDMFKPNLSKSQVVDDLRYAPMLVSLLLSLDRSSELLSSQQRIDQSWSRPMLGSWCRKISL